MRRAARVVSLIAIVALIGAACSKKSTTTTNGASGTTGGKPGAGVSVCEVSDSGGFNDKSFNQTAHKGVTDAESKLGVTGVFLESKSDQDYVPNINQCVQKGSNLTVTVGFLLGDATQAAATANPDLKFAIVDYAYFDKKGNLANPPNVEGLTFQTDQAAFLAGYLAAGVTKTGTIGTFGGINIPTVTIYMNGLAAGILAYNKDNGTSVKLLGWDPVKQDGTFTGDFTNQDNGKRIAEQFISQGADIILPVAGPVGLGAAAAAQDAGNVMMIGVDTDQFISAPEYAKLWLVSIEKHIDTAVYTAIDQVVKGDFPGGTNYLGTLENDGVGISPFHNFDSQVPAALKTKLDQLKAGIIDGSVSVDPADYAA
ncbi:MAG: BMP family ABC transporter substrate-binding protein [Actinomycetota bacterium]|nr:BMP family ABC transporter substrate-binding protein [Actinomycetota bacterium]